MFKCIDVYSCIVVYNICSWKHQLQSTTINISFQKPPVIVMIGAVLLVEIVYTDTKKNTSSLHGKNNTFPVSLGIWKGRWWVTKNKIVKIHIIYNLLMAFQTKNCLIYNAVTGHTRTEKKRELGRGENVKL